MAKLIFVAILIAMAVMTEGLSWKQIMSRRDPFPEPENPPAPRATVENNVTQRLDNFDPNNRATFEQRYYMNGEFFQPGGAIFVFLAGEWEITPYRLEYSLMNDLARELRGYMFYLEHRFYGQSRPTEDLSDANLRFLTVDQALADVAHFITHIKSNSVTPGARESPVIVIGGHYAGSLAVWFRQKYPHLALGAWASSAPLISYVDHFQYKEVSGAVYRHLGGDECYNVLERGFAQAEQWIADGRDDEIEDMFHLCNEIESEQDIQLFFAAISEFYSLLAQFDQIISIEGVCAHITGDHGSDVQAVASIIEYLDLLEDDCIDIDYEAIVAEDRRPEWDAPAPAGGFRQWSYQTCSQFGWYHSSSSRFQPYGSSFPVEFVYRACEDVFGPEFDQLSLHESSDRFNTIYGGLNPQVTNTLFVHGQLDPWRSAGVQHDLNPTAEAIVIEGASQANDLGPISADDKPSVEAAKLRIKETIRRWIYVAQGIDIIPL